jgi:hypothetical protein
MLRELIGSSMHQGRCRASAWRPPLRQRSALLPSHLGGEHHHSVPQDERAVHEAVEPWRVAHELLQLRHARRALLLPPPLVPPCLAGALLLCRPLLLPLLRAWRPLSWLRGLGQGRRRGILSLKLLLGLLAPLLTRLAHRGLRRPAALRPAEYPNAARQCWQASAAQSGGIACSAAAIA